MISCKIRRKSKIACSYSFHALTYIRYDFEYEDDDEEQDGDVDVENKYYSAKQLKSDDPEAAIDEFLAVPALEEEKGDM